MKLIRSLVFPWFVYFAAILGGMFAINIKLTKYQNLPQSALLAALGLGALLCLMANLKSLGDVGIWMSESIPDALRYGGSFRWIFRAIQAAIIAAVFWGVGQLSWVPLIWHAGVIPAVFTICLFVAVFSLLGPIVKWSSNLAWSRAFALILSLPVFAAVPATGVFLGDLIVNAYRASHAELTVQAAKGTAATPKLDPNEPVTLRARVMAVAPGELKLLGEWPMGSGKKTTFLVDTAQLSPKSVQKLPKATTPKEIALRVEPRSIKTIEVVPEVITERDIRNGILSSKAEKRAEAFKELYEGSRALCPNFTKEIQLALDPKGNKDVVLWAARDVECSDMRTVVGLPRLATLMTDHADPLVRAAAIRSMKKFGHENVRTVSYLLVKRLAEREPPEVVEATAEVLAPLGGDSLKWATTKLKSLLNASHVSEAAAKALIHAYNRDDLVAEYVAENLTGAPDARLRAVGMICQLPKPKRTIAEPHVSGIVASIKTGDQNDAGIRALDCLGKPGFQAIRQEVSQPKQLDRAVAARALAEFNVREEIPAALETASICVRDENELVRKYCAQTLGKIGAAALPKILELLDSSDSNLKESGRIALLSFEDPQGKTALEDVLRSNSGWMANSRKLSIAKAVGTALAKIETDKIEAEKLESANKADSKAEPKTEKN